MNGMDKLEARFENARKVLLNELSSGEALSMEFLGEDSLFVRFNGGKVRQAGQVDRSIVSFRLFLEGKSMTASFNVSGNADDDSALAARILSRTREDAALLPEDPYRQAPKSGLESSQCFEGSLPDFDSVIEDVLSPTAGSDVVGIHAQGPVVRGAATSAGARHWFSAETFVTDWSMWLPNGKAVKSCYAGRTWDQAEHEGRLASAATRLEPLARQERKLEPREYRAYISPDALNEVMTFFSWHGLSERSIREGTSAYVAFREGRQSLSSAFSLVQDFSLGVEPRFNESGDVAPERLVLVDKGKLVSTLVSERSATEYGIPSNQATDWESLRSPSIGPGQLREAEALAALGSGVYVSNFHYLNWSDVESARITGMTRFACFWVENGKITAPIKDMRFDDSIYSLLGSHLEALTQERSLVTETASYGLRALGGALLPGILVSGLTFTL